MSRAALVKTTTSAALTLEGFELTNALLQLAKYENRLEGVDSIDCGQRHAERFGVLKTSSMRSFDRHLHKRNALPSSCAQIGNVNDEVSARGQCALRSFGDGSHEISKPALDCVTSPGLVAADRVPFPIEVRGRREDEVNCGGIKRCGRHVMNFSADIEHLSESSIAVDSGRIDFGADVTNTSCDGAEQASSVATARIPGESAWTAKSFVDELCDSGSEDRRCSTLQHERTQDASGCRRVVAFFLEGERGLHSLDVMPRGIGRLTMKARRRAEAIRKERIADRKTDGALRTDGISVKTTLDGTQTIEFARNIRLRRNWAEGKGYSENCVCLVEESARRDGAARDGAISSRTTFCDGQASSLSAFADGAGSRALRDAETLRGNRNRCAHFDCFDQLLDETCDDGGALAHVVSPENVVDGLQRDVEVLSNLTNGLARGVECDETALFFGGEHLDSTDCLGVSHFAIEKNGRVLVEMTSGFDRCATSECDCVKALRFKLAEGVADLRSDIGVQTNPQILKVEEELLHQRQPSTHTEFRFFSRENETVTVNESSPEITRVDQLRRGDAVEAFEFHSVAPKTLGERYRADGDGRFGVGLSSYGRIARVDGAIGFEESEELFKVSAIFVGKSDGQNRRSLHTAFDVDGTICEQKTDPVSRLGRDLVEGSGIKTVFSQCLDFGSNSMPTSPNGIENVVSADTKRSGDGWSALASEVAFDRSFLLLERKPDPMSCLVGHHKNLQKKVVISKKKFTLAENREVN